MIYYVFYKRGVKDHEKDEWLLIPGNEKKLAEKFNLIKDFRLIETFEENNPAKANNYFHETIKNRKLTV